MPTQIVAVPALGYYEIQANSKRSLIFIDNQAPANAVYLSDQGGTAGGIIIGALGWMELSQSLGWDTNGAWYLYSIAGSTPVVIQEGFGTPEGTKIAISPLQEPRKR